MALTVAIALSNVMDNTRRNNITNMDSSTSHHQGATSRRSYTGPLVLLDSAPTESEPRYQEYRAGRRYPAAPQPVMSDLTQWETQMISESNNAAFAAAASMPFAGGSRSIRIAASAAQSRSAAVGAAAGVLIAPRGGGRSLRQGQACIRVDPREMTEESRAFFELFSSRRPEAASAMHDTAPQLAVRAGQTADNDKDEATEAIAAPVVMYEGRDLLDLGSNFMGSNQPFITPARDNKNSLRWYPLIPPPQPTHICPDPDCKFQYYHHDE